MEITLEKIELVKDRTGVSYKEAKEALENADGSVVDAIISIEETIDSSERVNMSEKSGAVVAKLKEIVKKGNVSRIIVRNKEGEELVNLPVNAGIVGAVIAPWGVLAGIIASFGFRCVIEVVKDDGTIIDVSDRTTDAVEKASEKSSEVYEKVKNSETYEKVKGKTEETFVKASDAIRSRLGRKGSAEMFAEDFDVKDFEGFGEFEESEGEEK